MNDSKKLINNTLIYTIGSFGSKALSFMLLPLYSFYLTKSEFGIYDLVLTSINLLVPFVSLQISDALYRWLLDAKTNVRLQSRTITNALVILSCTSIIFIIIYLIVFHFYKIQYSFYFLPVLLGSCYFPFFQQLVRGLGNNKLYSIIGILNTVFLLILTVLFLVFLKKKLDGLFLSLFISNVLAIVFIFYKVNIFKYVSLSFVSKFQCKRMLGYSWPLIPNTVSWWLINASDRFIILFFLNAEANGIYAVSARLPAIITIMNSVFMLAWQDHTILTENSDHAKKLFSSKVFNLFVKFEMSFVFILIASAQYIVSYLIDRRFYDAWRYMPLLYIGTAFSAFSAYLGAAYLKAKRTRGLFTTTIIGGLINLVIGICLIRVIGLYSLALGTIVSFFVVYFLRKSQTKDFFQLDVDYWHLGLLVLTSFVFAFVAYLNNRYLNALSLLLSLVLFGILNKFLLQYFWAFIGKGTKRKLIKQ